MTASPWREQPSEQARLFNPAFLGALVLCSADGYQRTSQERHGLPYPLAFLVLPIVLHKLTREALPRTTRTSLPAWISVNAYTQVGFPVRASSLVSSTKDSIAVACRGGLIAIEGSRLCARAKMSTITQFANTVRSPEVSDCLKKAQFVGKWFSGSGDYQTIMALWGVRP
ncbi:three component ABC system middle component [Stenotrophomonas sp. PS02297]|uniref:three component ABC system middle component n=1 Tax=Stenotrophomonas sp. PS02297 TaxID=2991423 RepID=UPI00249C0DD6|nr:three component ABC system middle component [Stenotrophomonas sp. PS02297]